MTFLIFDQIMIYGAFLIAHRNQIIYTTLTHWPTLPTIFSVHTVF